ncbi:unnamed protein product [Aphanomyces euteiches]
MSNGFRTNVLGRDGVELQKRFLIVELAKEGNEAQLAATFGTIVTNVYSAHFRMTMKDIVSDSADTRHDVTVAYVIVYCSMITVCFMTLLFPKKKQFVQALKHTRGESALIGVFVLLACFAILVVSITGSLLSMIESTSCYLLAGGTGCR